MVLDRYQTNRSTYLESRQPWLTPAVGPSSAALVARVPRCKDRAFALDRKYQFVEVTLEVKPQINCYASKAYPVGRHVSTEDAIGTTQFPGGI